MNLKKQSMKYSSIVYNDTANGNGQRVSIFVQGCTCHCMGCFNKETWDFNKGKEFTDKELNEIMFVLKTYNKYYNGISILGGNPTDNLELCNLIIDTFRQEFQHTKDIWIWSGHTFEEIIRDKYKLDMISKCDVLVDGRFELNKKDINLLFRGSTNQRIIDVQKSLKQNKVIQIKKYTKEE